MTPFVIGLTGSIGMGKSTTARIFAAHDDVALWDADAAVHRLYGQGGAAVKAISAEWPQAITDHTVDRGALKRLIQQDAEVLQRIEAIVHPLVQQDRATFLENTSIPICVLDIPLLFETGAAKDMDLVVVVSIDAAEQRRRVLERPNMTADHFDRILASQIPDTEKRARADVAIETSSLEAVEKQVDTLLTDIRRGRYA
ncbi:dephospho-CoA kinase [Actibacterium sp. 188UL27-1]|uniref:dephospho-CoA kinase n=1 Tax=Actibacterium sp. 188UL27-1 TaxID=2786961 RepID=UPI0019563A32|nr:dephospho-CoA kinase [Actibacterium sp. 188UL27-1]MBM7067265.1 dephospho-CoA kinase [Actibacterium sp. 188UL27-1]